MEKPIAFATAMFLLCNLACGADPAPTAPEPRARPPIAFTPVADMPVDHPDLGDLRILSRGPRRLSVDQLERAIEQIGNLEPGTVKIPENLALTLGRPDYVKVTEESLSPSPLFMKFMMDLGGIVCGQLRDAEPLRPVEQRVFLRYESKEQNLAHLLVRFTGIEGDAAQPYVLRLARVYEAGVVGGGTELKGYEAACIALFTSPEFLLY